jgi:hypothetical protein
MVIKRLFIFVLPFLLCLAFVSCETIEPEPEIEKEVSKRPFFTSFSFRKENNQTLFNDVKGEFVEDSVILVSCFKVDNVRSLIATFEGNFRTVEVNGVLQYSDKSMNDYTDTLSYHLTDSVGNIANYTVLVNAMNGVPRLDIYTAGGVPIISKEDYVDATLTISNNLQKGGNGVYECEIRGRGNATWNNHPKKPYKIKLKKKTSLFGFPAEKDWVLLADYCDKSLMRTAYIFGLSKIAGMEFSVHFQYCDLYLNGEYRGTYILTEQVEKSKKRVAIEDDGYLIEDDLYYEYEPIYFTTSLQGYNYTFKHPNPSKGEIVVGDERYNYIKGFLDDFERVLYSDEFTDPDTGYRQYIDIESFVKWFLATELPGNLEPNLFYYMPQKGGKLKIGPIWDAEWSLGLAAKGGDYYGWHLYPYEAKHDIAIWAENKYYKRLLLDPYFVSQVQLEWSEMKKRIESFQTDMNDYRDYIKHTQESNFTKWPILDEYVSVGLIALGSWEAEVDYIEDFFAKRLEWFDGYITSLSN